jgi:hypothetical protein
MTQPFLNLILLLVFISTGLSLSAQTTNSGTGTKHILFETNEGYHDLRATEKSTFVTYTIPAEVLVDEFFGRRRMITEIFMAGVNFATDSSELVIEQFWDGIKVQQCLVTPALIGAPAFAANQNRPLDIRTQVKRENGPLNAVTLRNHSYWQTDFEGTTFFGQGDEFSWGNTTIDLSQDINVEWKYRWSTPHCHFYFDHLRVEY